MALLRIVSLLLLIVCASNAAAHDAPRASPAASFAAIDRDADGSVSLEEVAGWTKGADRNSDGKLSREEFVGAHAAAHAAHTAASREAHRNGRISAKFAAADRNGDGVWDRSEIVAESRRHFELIETAVNNDKSNTLRHEIKMRGASATEADYLAHHTAVIAVADTNKDGRITAAEYMKWTKDATK